MNVNLRDQVFADLRSDFMFKRDFGQKNILISFLNSILKTDRITDVEYDSFERIKQIFSVENYCF